MRILSIIVLLLCLLFPDPAAAAELQPTVYSDPIISPTSHQLADTLKPSEYKTFTLTEKRIKAPPQRPVILSNSYDAGNCTWYAKSRRPDLPDNLGNANTWAIEARKQGWDVSNTPRVGSIAVDENLQPWGHVMYVERVEGNTVFVTEMNVAGLGVISSNSFDKSRYVYIY